MSRSIKFQPHDYATSLIQSTHWRSDRTSLYRWIGTHWQATTDTGAISAAYHWLVKNQLDQVSPENAVRAFRAALMFLPALPDTVLLSLDTVVVPCRNGYLHLPHMGGLPVLLPADPELGIQHVLAVDYDPALVSAPLFEKFLYQALPWDDVRGRVQEYIGYTLLPDTRYQRAQLWLGDGANGKGVLSNIVQQLHGAVAAVRLDDLAGFKLSGLVGASLVYCDEVPKGRIDEQLLKSLIAGERVQVDRKYLAPLSLRLQGKWLVLGNHVPVITDHSTGFWRRWDIVQFGATIPERDRDPMLANKIVEHELSAVLNWAVIGLQRLLARNGFDCNLPAPLQHSLQIAKTESNSIMCWMQDIEIAPGSVSEIVTRRARLYCAYKDWCLENRMQAFSSMKWWQFIERSFGDKLILKRKREKSTDNPDWFCNLVPQSGASYAFN
jgi:putative DNA primase/helicase